MKPRLTVAMVLMLPLFSLSLSKTLPQFHGKIVPLLLPFFFSLSLKPYFYLSLPLKPSQDFTIKWRLNCSSLSLLLSTKAGRCARRNESIVVGSRTALGADRAHGLRGWLAHARLESSQRSCSVDPGPSAAGSYPNISIHHESFLCKLSSSSYCYSYIN